MEPINKRFFWSLLAVSLVIAFLSYSAPATQMPLNYDAMIWRSVPLAILWGIVLAVSLWRLKTWGLWLLLGAPWALYWPIWLIFNHFPPCYYAHMCA